jgi:asparagine synthase (glutamine-hydrolysing)
MCGIVGMAARSPVDRTDVLTTMRDMLAHRGPDDAGVWWAPDRRVGLANRRLAIVDLSPGGHQPMADVSGQLWITYNGEIYNHRDVRRELEGKGYRFRTESDTEVILGSYRAWGVDCLSHLNGMFAFGLYDSATRRLFLARDRAGEKPLFYWHEPGRLVFASELKALMANPVFPRDLDLQALDYYLAYGYVPGDMCILRGVRKLAPGQAMTYDLDTDGRRAWRYWQLPEPSDVSPASPDDLSRELESLLEDAVRRQLVADVPVGVSLSGGIDSSLLTAIAARVSSAPVRTFTVTFPGHATHDEGPHARLVAEHFGTRHTELAAEPASVDLLPALARQYDEPIADSSMVPTYLVSRLIRQHAKVALSGDGGDELFGGYRHYQWIQRGAQLRRVVPGPIRRLVGMASQLLPVGLHGRNHLIAFGGDARASIAHVNLYFDRSTRRRLLAPASEHRAQVAGAPEAYRAGLCRPGRTSLRQATEADFHTTLVDAYLVKIDRASMLNSLEMRAPWLDHRIVEFAFGRLPDDLRATAGELKILPRRLARRLLPPTLDLRRKWGLSLPLTSWFKGQWGAYMEAVLNEADPHLLSRRVIGGLIAGQRRGFENTARLFALTLFELWRREYRVACSGATRTAGQGGTEVSTA